MCMSSYINIFREKINFSKHTYTYICEKLMGKSMNIKIMKIQIRYIYFGEKYFKTHMFSSQLSINFLKTSMHGFENSLH